MPPSMLDVVKALERLEYLFTVTKATVRVAPSLGGYVAEVEGPNVSEELVAMERENALGEILSVSGIAHPPVNKDWVFAFRVDPSGPQIASNAPNEAVQQIAPQLREIVKAE